MSQKNDSVTRQTINFTDKFILTSLLPRFGKPGCFSYICQRTDFF